MSTPPNLSFWLYHFGARHVDNPDYCGLAEGPVKIKLKPGQRLSHTQYTRNEEAPGYSSQSERWTHDGDGILREAATHGADCDGRLSRFYTDRATNLAARPDETHPGVSYPQWEEVEATQRDYSAEAMNY